MVNTLLRVVSDYLIRLRRFHQQLEEIKKQVKRIREDTSANLSELEQLSIENLEAQGIKIWRAKSAGDAMKILKELIREGEIVAKAKSNTLREIGVEELKDRNEIIETDCGEFLAELCEERHAHPIIPLIHLSAEQIAKKIREKCGKRLRDGKEIVDFVREQVRKKLANATVALTGANAISSDGAIFLVENEGNISLITRMCEKHIVVAGIDKLVRRDEDALLVCKACSLWAGVRAPSYISVITGPSKTSDIEGKAIVGAQGAKEVHLILLDNGRKKMLEEGFEELFKCIGCGACLYFCPVYKQLLNNYGFVYFGARGICSAYFAQGMSIAFEELSLCANCSACKHACPLEIDLGELMRKLRERAIEEGKELEEGRELVEAMKKYGNPFGEEREAPTKLFCC